jgi:multiple sugar transport system substrate-binding protein
MSRLVRCGLSVVLIALLAVTAAAAPYDFGGQTVRISGTFPNATTFGINFEDARGIGHVQEVEEMFNVKIEWVNDDSAYNPETFIANVLAGDPVADIQLLDRGRAFHQIAAEGLLTPLDDILTEEYLENIPEVYKALEHWKHGDTIYGFSLVDASGWCVYWNKSLFEREGLPDPYELYYNGEWTWEAMREIAIQATKDTDGDGEIDQYGISIDPGIGCTDQVAALLATNNAAVAKIIDGKVTFTLDEPEALAVYEYLQQLIHEDKVVAFESQYAIFQGNRAMTLSHPWWFFYTADPEWMEDDCGLLPYPIGPNGTPGEYGSYSAANWNWVIPKTTKYDPRALIELYNALYMASYDYVIDDPEERLVNEFATYVTDRRDLEIYRNLVRDLKLAPYVLNFFWPDFENFEDFNRRVTIEGENPAAAVAGIKDAVQARLDEIFKQ